MKVVKVYVMDKLVGEYPDCRVISRTDRIVHQIVPVDVSITEADKKMVAGIVKDSKHVSIIEEMQEDK